MHTLMRVTMGDIDTANRAVSNGTIQRLVQEVSKMIKPESTFFTADQGLRTAYFIFDLKDASLIPQIAEPFFMALNARVEFLPGMDLGELTKGMEAWSKQEASYMTLS